MKKTIFISMSLLLLFGSAYSLRQIKIGCVDVDEVFNTYPGIDDIRKKLLDERKKYQVEIDKRKDEIGLLEKDYSVNTGVSEEEKQRRDAELELKRELLGEFITESNDKVSAFKDELTKPIFIRISSVIQEVAGEKGFSFVFRKGNDILLFIDREFDITGDVKARLRKDLNLE